MSKEQEPTIDAQTVQELKTALKQSLLEAKSSKNLDKSQQAIIDQLEKEVDQLQLKSFDGIKISKAHLKDLKKTAVKFIKNKLSPPIKEAEKAPSTAQLKKGIANSTPKQDKAKTPKKGEDKSSAKEKIKADKGDSLSETINKTIDNDTKRLAKVLFENVPTSENGQLELNSDQRACIQTVFNDLENLGGTVERACTNIQQVKLDRDLQAPNAEPLEILIKEAESINKNPQKSFSKLVNSLAPPSSEAKMTPVGNISPSNTPNSKHKNQVGQTL